jgi:peroxiredoxin
MRRVLRLSPLVFAASFGVATFATACADKAPAPSNADGANSAASMPLTFDSARVLSAVSNVGAAPILALAPDGRYATAWVSAPDGGTDGRLYVQVSRDVPGVAADVVQRELRDALGPIEPHGEAPPKLAWSARSDGSLTLGALYVVGKIVPGRRFPASALRFVRSDDGGDTWSAPVTVTDDTTKGLDADFGSHNFHALYAAPNGTFHVAWLDGRAGKSAVYTTHSTDGGRTWARNVRVVPMGAPLTEACPCCRTAIAADAEGHVYLAWRAVIPDTSAKAVVTAPGNGNGNEHAAHGATGPTIRDIVIARSDDGGTTWGAPQRVHADNWVFDGCPHAGPSLALDSTGVLHAAWWTGKPGAAGVFYTRSSDQARSFSSATPLGVADASQPAHVQLAVRGRTVFATWDDGTKRVPAVVLRTSHDGGATFDAAVAVSDAGKAAAFPVLVAAADARALTIAWSEQNAEAAARAAQQRPNMKDPKAIMPLPSVGNTQVRVRHARLGQSTKNIAASSDVFTPLRVGDITPRYDALVLAANGTTVPVNVAEPGQLTLVNVWATWCTSCREEMADLQALHEQYGDRGLRVIGVSVDQGNPQKVVRFARAQKLGFAVAHDPAGTVQQQFGVVGVPETILIDGSGRVRAKVSGNVHGQLLALRQTIDALLAPAKGAQ